MDKRSWHSPLKDGRPYFCQWKSGSQTRKKNNVVLNFETKEQRRLSLYAFKLILTNIQSELIDKSTIISTRRWTNGLGTAHSKMGGPTFVNEKVVHKLEKKKCSAELWNKSATDYHYRHLNWFLQISNLRSLTKAPLFPLEDGQTVLAQPTQRWAALLLSMKKWFTNSRKKKM